MIPQATKKEILAFVDGMTRELSSSNYKTFTTSRIADECHVSRSLASQYLNELVRQGLIVKVNERPVLFFHRKGLERYLGRSLEDVEYGSLRDMLNQAGKRVMRDFDKAVGFEFSSGSCIDHLKSAVRYPPHGLPVLLVGEHGTGKQLMSELTFEFGVNEGILPPGARYVVVDCARYEQSDLNMERDIFGEDGSGGAVREARGGVVFINRFDHLSHAARELVIRRITEGDVEPCDSNVAPARFMLSTARSFESGIVKMMARSIPVVIQMPRFVDRGPEERMQLALHFLRIEGRRVAADIQISRGALRALIDASFSDNVDGLRSCITNCCANAYLNREDEALVIHTYNLPADVISSVEFHEDDDELVNGNRIADDPFMRVASLFQRVLDPLPSYRDGSIGFSEFLLNASLAVRAYGDYMNFEDATSNPRVESYERLVSPIVEEVNRAYGIELTRRVSRLVAQSLFAQIWGGTSLATWKRLHVEQIQQALDALQKNLQEARSIVEQITSKTKTALGMGLDSLSLVLLYVEVAEAIHASGGPRDYLGVIMCHGYSTATSIADAANRIVRQHVFEAIDMTYEQELADAVGQLSRLLKRYSHCRSIVVLVDTGSLESVHEAVGEYSGCDVYVGNNVSTGLAVEVGLALAAHEDLEGAFLRAENASAPRHTVVRCSNMGEAIVFCSELGIETADKLRRLIQDSIPGDTSVRLITYEFSDLQRQGNEAQVFGAHRVRAIVGTMDPGVTVAPFVALEDILYQGGSDTIDQVLFRTLGRDGIKEFRANLLRNVTLRNVLSSITILNPETLYIEADRAVRRLAELSGREIDARRRIGVYVHLCGMIERLVTKTFIDSYPDVDDFTAEHADFISWFREAFGDMSRCYRVEIPVSEIAYVHHMLHARMADKDGCPRYADAVLEDE